MTFIRSQILPVWVLEDAEKRFTDTDDVGFVELLSRERKWKNQGSLETSLVTKDI